MMRRNTKHVHFSAVVHHSDDYKQEEEPLQAVYINNNITSDDDEKAIDTNDMDGIGNEEEDDSDYSDAKLESAESESDESSSEESKNSNSSCISSAFGGKIKRPQLENKSDKNEYPRYINKCYWTRSDDEKLEQLIDRTVLQVLNSRSVKALWNKQSHVEKLYDDKTFRLFVDAIYEGIDGQTFINSALYTLYKHQIDQSLNKTKPEKKKKLSTDKQIFNQMQCVEFIEFDTDRSGSIDFSEFTQYFHTKNIQIGKQKLHKMFRDIKTAKDSEGINKSDFNKWKESLQNNCISTPKIKQKRTLSISGLNVVGLWIVWFKPHSKIYYFNEGVGLKSFAQKRRVITTIHYNEEADADNNFKWARFVTKTKDMKHRLGADFRRNHANLSKAKPKGYWHIVENDDNNEIIAKRDLDLIFMLLHYYYLSHIEEQNTALFGGNDDPLRKHLISHQQRVRDEESSIEHDTLRDTNANKAYSLLIGGDNGKGLKRIEMDNKIIFQIKQNKYRLKYWNKRGKYVTTALVLEKLEHKSKRHHSTRKEIKAKELCYLRFNTDFEVKQLEWQWFDYDTNSYMDYDKKQRVIQELEASFLGNDERNFNPKEFELLNNCLLPELKSYMVENNISPKDGYIFSIEFASGIHDRKIASMSQVSFDRYDSFARKIRRMTDGTDSLLTHYQNSNMFSDQWKAARKLLTKAQQKYFFSYIVAIAAKIKYIDIEFANQTVLLPSGSNESGKKTQDFMNIDARDVEIEQSNYSDYDGYLIPQDRYFENPNKTKTKILRKYKITNKSEYRWFQEGEGRKILFSKEQAQFLRFAECIRKYVLESELGDTLNTLWPWYQNSYHSIPNVDDSSKYNNLMKNQFFLQSWDEERILTILYQHKKNLKQIAERDPDGNDDNDSPIRHKRKFAAYLLLDSSDVLRNLNILKAQLDPLLHCISDKAISKYLDEHFEASGYEREIYKIIYKQQVKKHPADFQHKIDKYVSECIRGKARDSKTKEFWQQNIQEINYRFMKKKEKYAKEKENDENFKFEEGHLLFNEHFDNIQYLDIDRFQLPIFEEFVCFFFVASDENRYRRIHESKPSDKYYGGDGKEYYRVFLEEWRNTPKWYTYSHDILLLELVLRNGVNGSKIVQDLEGVKDVEYKIRLKCEDYFTRQENHSNIYHKHQHDGDRYYQFKKWCKIQYNLWHRLKYITNIIIKNLFARGGDISLYKVRIENEEDIPTFSCKSRIFSDYQKQTHINSVKQQNKLQTVEPHKNDYDRAQKFDVNKDEKTHNKQSNPSNYCCCKCVCCCCHIENYQNLETFNGDDTDDDEEVHILKNKRNLSQLTRRSATVLGREGRIRANDPFLDRNLDIELMEVLQSFDLLKYGEPMILFIIEQLKKQMIQTYWKILGAIVNVLPPQLAISALKNEESMDILRHGEPSKLKQLCLELVSGASFKPAAALAAAALFDELAEDDLIQEDSWKTYGDDFEAMAFQEINKIESNHLLYVLLNIPLLSNERKSLVELALDGQRIEFLNNDRINSVMHHMFVHGYLQPGEEIETTELEYVDMLYQLWNYPFDFYLSARGYHWITNILFMLYFVLVCVYAFLRPMQEGDLTHPSQYFIEILFWICNGGYVLFECFELWEKGPATYFNLDVKGQTNLLDTALCALWIFLFLTRAYFVCCYEDYDEFDVKRQTALQEVYIFVFGLQITLLTLRSLTLFSNAKYLGVLLKIIKLMTVEIVRFLYVYVVVMVGILFALWFVVVSNVCNTSYSEDGQLPESCDDYQVYSAWFGLKYVFEVFVGTGDLSGVGEQPMGIIFMVAVTFFGTLILTNLLIALMTTKYEEVQSKAKAEVIFNATELTVDLTSRSRQMPPPINIIVTALSLTIHILNFFTALLHPQILNIYNYIDFSTFEKFRRFHMWRCAVSWKKAGKVELDKEGQQKLKSNYKYTRKKIIFFYITSKISKLKSFCLRKCCHKQRKHHSNGKNRKNKRKYRINNRQRSALSKTHKMAHGNWQILHKGCYAQILVEDNTKKQNKKNLTFHSAVTIHEDPQSQNVTNAANLKAITMSQLLTQFENESATQFDTKDTALLKQLTSTETLFCEYCNRPILSTHNHLVKQLTTPYAALLDLLSALIFIVIPIAWIALLLILSVMSVLDGVGDWFDKDHQRQKYKSKDFDREYFPNQFVNTQTDQ